MPEESAMMVAQQALSAAQRAVDRLDGHEKFCAAMAQNTNDVIHEMKAAMSTFSKIGVGVLVAIAGWAVVELYSHLDQAARVAPPAAVTRTLR